MPFCPWRHLPCGVFILHVSCSCSVDSAVRDEATHLVFSLPAESFSCNNMRMTVSVCCCGTLACWILSTCWCCKSPASLKNIEYILVMRRGCVRASCSSVRCDSVCCIGATMPAAVTSSSGQALRKAKEAFVSNQHGTSAQEIVLLSFVIPVCAYRGAWLIRPQAELPTAATHAPRWPSAQPA